MARGIIRKLDELGRLTIPKEYRRAIGAKERDRLGMYVDRNILHLLKVDKDDDDFIGFARNLDELGRWTLPIELRRTLNCEIGQKMDIYVDNSDLFENTKVICISKPGCHFCNSTVNLIEVKGHSICKECAEEINEEYMHAFIRKNRLA